MSLSIRNLGLILGLCMSPLITWAQNSDPDLTDFGLGNAQAVAAYNSIGEVVYKGDPIRILLAVGQERRLVFDGSVEIGIEDSGIPDGQKPRQKMDIQIYGNNVLVKAHQTLLERIIVTLTDGPYAGLSLPINLTAITDKVSLGPLAVRSESRPRESLPQVAATTTGVAGGISSAVPEDHEPTSPEVDLSNSFEQPTGYLSMLLDGAISGPGFVTITRFVVKQFYSPARLVDALPGAERIPVVSGPIRLVRHQEVTSEARASWKIGGQYVTAVEIRNQLPRRVATDPRKIIGRWRAATFVHNNLDVAGEPGATSLLILVSDEPFEQSLRINSVALNATDSTANGS